LFSFVFFGCSKEYQPQNGDIIFQTSLSSQGEAIQRATKSEFSHMGILYIEEGQVFVYEAVEPVKVTPFREWIDRGEGGHYVAKRLVDAEERLTPEVLERMLAVGKVFEGKHYDHYFEWSDDRIYCSELVWKIYKRALNLEIGKPQKLREFDLDDPIVKTKIRERFGDLIPMDETVISPAAMFASELLETVYER
jgi:hypothetical protein